MQIDGKQIKDASVADVKLITPYIKADGSRTYTGPQSAGGNNFTNLADPVANQDAATKAYVDAIAMGARDPKDGVRAATTANITLSGTQTIDTVVLAVGDRVLVKNQTTGSQNGIYVVASGAWTRSADADTNAEVTNGMTVPVTGGTNIGVWQLVTADPIVLNTTALTYIAISVPSIVPTIADKGRASAVTSGNGATTALTMTSTPGADSYVEVVVNGVSYQVGNGVKTKDCYFSADGGTTAKLIANIASGDTLYWNGLVALFDLAATDIIDFNYSV